MKKILLTLIIISLFCVFSTLQVSAVCNDMEEMLAPSEGSVWDKALANPNFSSGGESSNSGGDNTGGRLVDPKRDVYWSDGTITPDAL